MGCSIFLAPGSPPLWRDTGSKFETGWETVNHTRATLPAVPQASLGGCVTVSLVSLNKVPAAPGRGGRPVRARVGRFGKPFSSSTPQRREKSCTWPTNHRRVYSPCCIGRVSLAPHVPRRYSIRWYQAPAGPRQSRTRSPRLAACWKPPAVAQAGTVAGLLTRAVFRFHAEQGVRTPEEEKLMKEAKMFLQFL